MDTLPKQHAKHAQLAQVAVGPTVAVGWASKVNAGTGSFTARNPGRVLIVSLLLGLAICAGWARFRLETDADVLCE
jgi:hypothetical protein